MQKRSRLRNSMRLFRCCAVLLCFLFPHFLHASVKPDTSRIKELLGEVWEVMYKDPDSALALSERALELARVGNADLWEAKSQNQLGVVHWVRTDYDSALYWLNTAHETFSGLGDSAGMASVQNNFGITYLALDYYDLAREAFEAALPQIEAQGDPARLATLYNNLGWVCHTINYQESSITYFDRAFQMTLSLEDPQDTAMLHNNLALAHRDLGNLDGALLHGRRSVHGYQAQGNPRGLIHSLYNHGGTYALQDSFAEADSLYQRALALATEYKVPAIQGNVWVKLAELAMRENDPRRAIAMGDSALRCYTDQQEWKARMATYEVLRLAHAEVGEFEAAYGAAREVIALEDSILNEEKVRSISELTLKYESRLKDREIENLRQQEKLARWQKGGLAAIIFLILLVAFVVYRRQRAIIQREKALQEKVREAAEAREALNRAELKAAELERARLEADVQHKSKEISNLAMGIIRHHELLQNLDQNLQAIRKKANPEVKNGIQELAVMVVSEMGAEKERQDLQLYIEEAEQRFFQVLDEKYPQLTPRERRLCALVRMGYSSKQIAALFNIQINSVDMGRYRLRKKLDPEMQVSLSEFLTHLSAKNP